MALKIYILSLMLFCCATVGGIQEKENKPTKCEQQKEEVIELRDSLNRYIKDIVLERNRYEDAYYDLLRDYEKCCGKRK